MTVFVTPDHDTSMINSDIIMTDLIMDDLDVEIYDHLSGDEYANEVINSIGFFTAHYGEV